MLRPASLLGVWSWARARQRCLCDRPRGSLGRGVSGELPWCMRPPVDVSSRCRGLSASRAPPPREAALGSVSPTPSGFCRCSLPLCGFVAFALYPFAMMRLSQECGCELRPGSPPRDHFGDFRYTSFTLRILQRWGPYFCQSPPPPHTHAHCTQLRSHTSHLGLFHILFKE